MIRTIFLCLLACWSAPAFAQTVRTQTGEHADFTRVVLFIPSGAMWTVGRIDDGYGIRIEGATDFDLADFFELIPRDRVAEATVIDQQTLALTLNCDCAINASLDQPNILVLDISDGQPFADDPYQTALFPPDVIEDVAADRSLPDMDFESLELVPVSPLFLTQTPTPAQVLWREPLLPAPEILQQQLEERQRASGLEVAVAESLSRAASQGLLELNDALIVSPEVPKSENQIDTMASEEPVDTSPAGQIRPGIVANSSVDLGLSNALIDHNIMTEFLDCWPDELVDVASWAPHDVEFSKHLSVLRSSITGEFDKVNPNAVEALARFYLYYGFGREAVQTLGIDGANSRVRSAIRSLGEILDGDPVSERAILEQLQCPGRSALWAVLASGDNENLGVVDRQFVAREFKLLPDGLQVHLGPRLASLIVALNDPDTAENVLALSAEATLAPVETAMVESAIAQERGNIAEAAQALATLTETEPDATPEAVVELIRLKIRQNQTVSDETLSLAETMKFEYRNGPELPELARSIIEAHVQNGEFTLALAAWFADADALPSDVSARAQNNILAGATAHLGDIEFVEMAFGADLDRLVPETQNAIAKRLISLGFPERALDYINDPTIGSAMTERRYLLAEAAMIMNDFALAEAHLAGVTSERASQILSFGPDGIPLAQIEAASQEEIPFESETAWRNGNWLDLTEGEDPLLRDVSALVLDTETHSPDPEAPLSSGRALIAEASEARATLDALIARFDAPLLSEDP